MHVKDLSDCRHQEQFPDGGDFRVVAIIDKHRVGHYFLALSIPSASASASATVSRCYQRRFPRLGIRLRTLSCVTLGAKLPALLLAVPPDRRHRPPAHVGQDG